MSRILICITLAAVLSGGSAAIINPTARLAYLPRTELVSRTGPENASQPSQRRFSWPLAGTPTVVRAFHAPAFRYGPGHRGVDLAAQAAAPVLAAGAGTVVFAGRVAGRGVVSVSHPGGLRTTYEPISATVAAGVRVSRGEQIGTVQPGHPGCPVTVCLHWGVFRWGALRDAEPRNPEQDAPEGGGPDREYLDPLRLIAATRVRLLPIDGRSSSPVTRSGCCGH